MADPDNTGEVLGDHIALVRQLEFDRMKTLEGRGERVLRTDLAILAAVVAGLTLLLGRSVPQHLHTATFWTLVASAVLLTPSLCCAALVQGATSKYSLTDGPTLRRMVDEKWDVPEREARFVVANRDIESISTLRVANNRRARLLRFAVLFQVAFVVGLIAAVTVEIVSRSI